MLLTGAGVTLAAAAPAPPGGEPTPDLPAPPEKGSAQAVTTYSDPGFSRPYGITLGPDGALWFTADGSGDGTVKPSIGRITPTGEITTYTYPQIGAPHAIVSGSDGALWFTVMGNFGTNPIGRISTSGDISIYSDPQIKNAEEITAGPDGALWVTDGYNTLIGRITTDGVVSSYVVGTAPRAITSGSDGAMWFTSANRDSPVGRITTDGAISYPQSGTLPDGVTPYKITSGADGALWFTTSHGYDLIGRITTSGALSTYTGSSMNSANGITGAPDGALWYINADTNAIGRLTASGDVSTYNLPGIDYPHGIVSGPDGVIWFTNLGLNTGQARQGSIGRIAPADTGLGLVGRDFGGRVRDPLNPVVAHFVPESTKHASDFSATIDWGDGGTSTGMDVTLVDNDGWTKGEGGVDIVGNHTYGDWNSYDVTVSVTERTGASVGRKHETSLTASIGEGILVDTPEGEGAQACTTNRSSFVVKPVGCRGRFVISFGNVITADRVAIVVPGINQTFKDYRANCYPTPIDDCPAANLKAMVDHAWPGYAGSTAVVGWLGYDTPQPSPEIASSQDSLLGAKQLENYVRELSLRRRGKDPSTLTLIGHSYGTTVVAHATQNGLRPTNVVFVGSPGTDLKSAAELGIDPKRVFAGKNPNDFVPETATDSTVRKTVGLLAKVRLFLRPGSALSAWTYAFRNVGHNIDPTHAAYG
ncbi:MAG: alpha/beta hydrolase, partial [Actinobacteria bacterium]|nr:alpha/beta hydrolase [Actinomycetota bacterium]